MTFWHTQPSYPLTAQDVKILHDATAYREQLLSLIAQAKKRIYITALYLQDDEAGRQVLSALHQASLKNPELQVKILVDFHRAQRGLIGAEESIGNVAVYAEMLKKYRSNVEVYGVPVKKKEVFGVLHLKGFVIDDTLFYSGASINNIYLQQHDRYRLDRYFLINQAQMSDSFVDFIENDLISSPAVTRLDTLPVVPLIPSVQKQLTKQLKRSSYQHGSSQIPSALNARLFIGVGRRKNRLNHLIKELFNITDKHMVLYTPYFNLPSPLLKALSRLLRKGKKITIVVGDKTANDFYQPPEQPFSKVAALPYFYETILSKFIKNKKKYVNNGQLDVFLWKHDDNSFHLKGICVDNRYHLLTGHNLNPRAWGLDIENGILIDDSKAELKEVVRNEYTAILQHCTRINCHTELEQLKDYPKPVKKLLSQAKTSKLDSVIKRFI